MLSAQQKALTAPYLFLLFVVFITTILLYQLPFSIENFPQLEFREQQEKYFLTLLNEVNFTAKELNVTAAKEFIGKIVKSVDFPLTNDDDGLTKAQLDGSILHFGDQTLLSYRLLQLLSMPDGSSEKKLRLAVIGGSNTADRHDGNLLFFEPLTDWLRKLFWESTKISVTVINAGIHAFNSEYFASCIEQRVKLAEVDILLLEHAINDVMPCPWMPGCKEEPGRPMEELTRAIWRVNPMIQIIQVNMIGIPYIFNTTKRAITCNWIDDEAYLAIARHYNVTSIQWKHIFCNSELRNEQTIRPDYMSELLRKYTASDSSHCGNLVHRHLGHFLITYFQHVLLKLQNRLSANRRHFAEFIKEETFRELKRRHSMKPIFSTTWIDGSDCFDRERVLNAFRGKRVPGTAKRGTTFHFHLNPIVMRTRVCQQREDGYLPRLSIGYAICGRCKPVQLTVGVTFNLLPNSSFRKRFNITTQHAPYQHGVVHPLPWLDAKDLSYYHHSMSLEDYNTSIGYNSFCHLSRQAMPKIESLDIEVKVMTRGYHKTQLHHPHSYLPYFVINYDCCRLSSDGKTIVFT